MEKNTNKDELLKAVADVLDEALQEYEKLAKMDNLELAEDPSRPMPKADETAEDEDEEKDGDEEAKEDDSKPEDDKEDEESDEDVENAFKSISAKMTKRGLMKSEVKADDLKKSEAAAEDLRKSIDDRFESLTKTIQTLAETVNKIASTPVRKGTSGLQPLRKNEEGTEAQPLNKAETVSKLLNLKKSGQQVDTALINRIETGRTSAADHASIAKLLG